MVTREKTKIRIVVLIFVVLTFLVFIYLDKKKVVEVIYFRKSSCVIIKNTDRIMVEIKEDFKERVNIKVINLDQEENLSPDKKILTKRYDLTGIPLIIIDEKEYTGEFTKVGIEQEICGKFWIKSGVCK